MAKRNIAKSLLITLIFSILLVGCGFVEQVLNQLPTVPVTPTKLVCPSDAVVPPTFLDLRAQSKLIVIVLGTKEHTGTNSGRVFEVLGNVLPNVLKPGDRVVVFRGGVKEFQQAIISYGNSNPVQIAVFIDTPEPPTTSTPYPTLTPGLSSYTNRSQEQQVHEKQTEQAAQSTADFYFYQCTVAVISTINVNLAVTERANVGNAVDNTLQQYFLDIEAYRTALASTPSPLSTAIPNEVYEGLGHASLVFSNECENYDKCILLIFDDLYDWRTADFNAAEGINFSNVDIVPVMLDCNPIYQPACQTPQARWSDEFRVFGAVFNPDNFRGQEDIEAELISMLSN